LVGDFLLVGGAFLQQFFERFLLVRVGNW
jgi:hypothetical protein